MNQTNPKEPRIIALKCPNCGGSECKEIGEDKYQCDFCKTKFVYRKDVPQTINNTTIYQGESTRVQPKTVLAVICGIVFFFVAIPLLVLFTTNRDHKRTTTATENRYIQSILPVPGKDSVYIWMLCRRENKGVYQGVIEVVNPFNNKTIRQIMLEENATPWDAARKDALVYADGKCWVLTKHGVRAFSTVSYAEVENSETLMKRHKELSSGLLKCEFKDFAHLREDYYMEANTKDGNRNYYIMKLDTVVSENDLDALEYRKTVFDKKDFPVHTDGRAYFYFNKNKDKGKLYIYDQSPIFTTITENFSMQEKARDFTPGRDYFFPEILYSDKNQVIICFLNDADEENSPRIIQSLSAKDGKVMWASSGEAIQKLPRVIRVRTAACLSGNQPQLVICYPDIHLKKDKNRAIGINMKDGSILFELPGEMDS